MLLLRTRLERAARSGAAVARAARDLPNAVNAMGAQMAACAGGAASGLASSAASVNVSVQVSVQVSGSVSAN